MKMVAASKLRKAQDLIINLRPYDSKLNTILKHLAATDIKSPFAEVREVHKVLVVVVTSNRGLCGAFNTAIARLAHQHIDEHYSTLRQQNHLDLICIGRKGFEYFQKRKYPLIGQNHDLFANISFETISELGAVIFNGFIDGKWDKVEIIYNKFKNVATQERVIDQILPIKIDTPQNEPKAVIDFIFEPDQQTIIRELIPQILHTQFYRTILDSNASEHGARMVAMDKATDNAEELIKDLKLVFNKARQAAITKEILEIVGGAEALSSR